MRTPALWGDARLAEAGSAPLPAGLTPHSLRRTFASVLYALGVSQPEVMAKMGHTDPKLAPSIYAQAMRRDEGEGDRLRALIEALIGHQWGPAPISRPPTQLASGGQTWRNPAGAGLRGSG